MPTLSYKSFDGTVHFDRPADRKDWVLIDLTDDEDESEDDPDSGLDSDSEDDVESDTGTDGTAATSITEECTLPPTPPTALERLTEMLDNASAENRPKSDVIKIEHLIVQHLHDNPVTVADVKLLIPRYKRCYPIANKLSTNIALHYTHGRISTADKEAMLQHILLEGSIPQYNPYWKYKLCRMMKLGRTSGTDEGATLEKYCPEYASDWKDGIFELTVDKLARYSVRKKQPDGYARDGKPYKQRRNAKQVDKNLTKATREAAQLEGGLARGMDEFPSHLYRFCGVRNIPNFYCGKCGVYLTDATEVQTRPKAKKKKKTQKQKQKQKQEPIRQKEDSVAVQSDAVRTGPYVGNLAARNKQVSSCRLLTLPPGPVPATFSQSSVDYLFADKTPKFKPRVRIPVSPPLHRQLYLEATMSDNEFSV